jgi:Reverse transcriptase (RNA-dependent DNA polymerase)
MSAISEFHERRNLELAWTWIKSNPDAMYKHYCGELYARFAIADDLLLDDLHDRLRRDIYEPHHATKILIPKKSGILRPYTILTVEDQIVYQSMANVVAERLAPRVRHRYMTQVFGHLYAGRTSNWFYTKWSDGYKEFNKAARKAFRRGLKYAASFDLTACYDSLDHGVLCHFLKQLGCELEFCQALREYLSVWTATGERIYQNHGIPQGPLSSGLISEAVLQYFDINTSPRSNLIYLRYVDDIRLFAKKEGDLRSSLVRLDRLSKDIGLFPQASKIDIHRIIRIEDELKSVSTPTEATVRNATVVDQKKLAKRLVQLSPRLTPEVHIEDETRFKYLFAFAQPSSRLNSRLLTISKARPDLVPTVARYFSRYRWLPFSVSRELIARIKAGHLYDHVTARWLDVIQNRLRGGDEGKADIAVRALWDPRHLSADLAANAGTRLIRAGMLTLPQTRRLLTAHKDWWARTEFVSVLTGQWFGAIALEALVNTALRDKNPDVSLAAAWQAAVLHVPVTGALVTINRSGGKALRQLGVLKRVGGRSCGVAWSMEKITGRAFSIKWKTVFGSAYRQAEIQAIQMKAAATTNATTFVNTADVFNDLLLSRLYQHDPSLGVYILGRLGSVLNSTRLSSDYPFTFRLCQQIHTERLSSNLSHPIVRATGRRTRRIPFRFLRTAKRLYSGSLLELEATW